VRFLCGTHMLPVLLRHWYGGVNQNPYFREQVYLSSCCGAYDDLNALLTPEWRNLYNAHEELEAFLTPFFRHDEGDNFLDKLSVANIQLQAGHMHFPLMERMTGAYGVSSLSPLSDERLIALSFRLPSALKFRRGSEKEIIRQAYSQALPNWLIKRTKSGVEFPTHFWLRKECKKYARQILGKRAIKRAGIFNPNRVEELLSLKREQTLPQHERALWLLISFELWRRKVLNEKI
ncbi:MAG: hypothetical protein D3910_16890, partial [Candidatus Electrothrix sp. ATG2]|nr:hypothetical protein [Candidatus Electrothrix sp. ATG2]